MKQCYRWLLSLPLVPLTFACTVVNAADESKEADVKKQQIEWTGVWKDENGTLISIRESDRFLDIAGNDMASVFNVACIVEKNNSAKCVGEGTNHVQGLRYIYQSTLTLDVDNQLTENWEAITAKGSLQGKSIYLKVGEIQSVNN